MSVPATTDSWGGNSARSSAFNSTRSDDGGGVDFDLDNDNVHIAKPTPVHTATIVSTKHSDGTFDGGGGADDRVRAVRGDPHERKRSVCRIVLLVLLLMSFITIAVLSYLAFVDLSISVLVWGLCMIPLGLFLLTCWCACWPATALEKKISACLRRNCCHMNC